MNNIMIDLETLSTHKNARIMTIAAVHFDLESGFIGDTLHIGLHRAGYDNLNSHTSTDTLDFWLHNDQEAALDRIKRLIAAKPYATPRALEKLAKFISCHPFSGIWSNGASFDLSILHSAYTAHDMPIPWQYWQERDCRTLVDAARQITGIDPKKQIAFEGHPHDALCDAIYQARYVTEALQRLKHWRPPCPA